VERLFLPPVIRVLQSTRAALVVPIIHAIHALPGITTANFFMEKMAAGFNAESQDWRYTLIMPNGQVLGTTGGKDSAKMGFCAKCHAVMKDRDGCFYLDEEYRRK